MGSSIEIHGVIIRKPRRTELDLGPQPAEALDGIMFLNRRHHGTDTIRHLAEIDRRHIHRRQAIGTGIFNGMIHPGGFDQGFTGNAPVMQTITA